MPNQFTSLDDIVHSDAFGNYVNRDSIEKNPLFQAGLVNADPDFAAAIAKNGGTTHKTVLVPNFGDIDGDTQDLVDGTAITSEKLDTDWEELPAIGKAKAMAFYDSTVDLTVADPARRIADRVAPYWARQNKKFMLTALKGALAVDDFSDNVLDATDAEDGGVLSNDIVQSAFQLLGDNQDILTTIYCHSAVAMKLKNIGTSQYVQNLKDGQMTIDAYQTKRILKDDALAPTNGVYPIYILGPGALVLNTLPCANEYETKREAEFSRTTVYTRKRYVLGPRGFKYTFPGTRAVAANGATNAELETAANWTLVWEPKRIPIVKLLARVAAA